jgi:hypothetical protein
MLHKMSSSKTDHGSPKNIYCTLHCTDLVAKQTVEKSNTYEIC